MSARVKRGLSILMIALGFAGGASAFAGDSVERTPTPNPTRVVHSKLETRELGSRFDAMLRDTRFHTPPCRTVQCFNRRLKKIGRAIHGIMFEIFNCEQYVDVTSYFGYDYNGVPASTSALDYTDPGTAPTDRMLVYTCV